MIVGVSSWGLNIVIATAMYGLVVVKPKKMPHVERPPKADRSSKKADDIRVREYL